MVPQDSDAPRGEGTHVPRLETVRLLLRPITRQDAPAIQAHFGRWEIISNLAKAVPWPYPGDGAVRFIEDVVLPGEQDGTKLCWAITEKARPDALIGIIDYRVDDERDNRGFWLAEPFQGRGYMTEAVEAFQDHVLLELGVERIYVMNSITNTRSRRIKEKTGARLLGEIEVDHHSGSSRTERWEVTREAWAKIRGRTL